MADGLVDEVVGVIAGVLASRGAVGIEVSIDSGMGNPSAWDSLAFVEIFTTVSERLGLDVSDDDAIHFMTVREIVDFIATNRN
ncbi:MAG: acyl carrier protein [Actinobacteria bacterium]|nr:acyl carrier protein [Actinomycetota bacterium]